MSLYVYAILALCVLESVHVRESAYRLRNPFVKINFNFKSKCPSMRANKMIGASWLAWRRTNYLEINKRDNFGIQRVVSLELSSRISCESLRRWTTNAFAAKHILQKFRSRTVKTRRIHFELSSLTPSRKKFSSLLNCFLSSIFKYMFSWPFLCQLEHFSDIPEYGDCSENVKSYFAW